MKLERLGLGVVLLVLPLRARAVTDETLDMQQLLREQRDQARQRAQEAQAKQAADAAARNAAAQQQSAAAPAAGTDPCASADLAAKIGAAVSKACDDIKGKVVWGSSGGSYSGNPDYWNVEKDGYLEFAKDKGHKPSEAVGDFVKPYDSPKYKVECVSGMQIALYKAIMDVISPAKFDQLFSGGELVITTGFSMLPGNGYAPPAIKPYLRENGDATLPADAAFLAALAPGTVVYFRNPGATGAWQGENAIYLGAVGGERQYCAHPFGKVTESQLLAGLAAHKNADPSAAPAYMHQGTTCVTQKLATLAP